jgi:predicted dehydrogenase
MEEHFSDPEISMAAIAEAFDMSTSRLSLSFKDRIGMTPSEYLTLLRTESAKRLLSQTGLTVREISAQVGYYDSGSWRATWAGEGGGVLLNQCPHQLDLWQWILGMPVRLQSHMRFGQWHDIEVEDDVTTYMEYENGATGVFVTSTGDAHGTNRLEIQMDRARLTVENDRLSLLEYEVGEPEWSRTNKQPFAAMPARKVPVETDGQNPQHVGVLNAWAGAILWGEPLVAGGEEGLNGLMLSNAMHLSAFLGRPVDLPIDEDLYYAELMKRVSTSRCKAGIQSAPADTRGSY